MEKSKSTLSDFFDWVDLLKAPPGPPPRPGLEWRERTSRWIRPETGTAVVEDSPSSEGTDKAGIHVHSPIELDPTRALDLRTQIQEFEVIYSSIMMSLTELFSEGNVSGRIKTLESAVMKIRRKGFSKLSDLTDVVGTRVEFPDNEDIYEAISEIEQRFTVREKERHFQKDGYYSATHLIIEVDNKSVEIQLRTTSAGRLAEYAHDVFYKHPATFSQDSGLIDSLGEYLHAWSNFIHGIEDIIPECPEAIRIAIGCLEDMQRVDESAQEGQEVAAMIEKGLVDDLKVKIFELIHKITAPEGKYRLIEVDEFTDPFETGNVINDFVFLEEAQQEQAAIQQQNPTVKYFIYDEDSKIVV